jgi:hypothetical protein
MQIAKRNIVKKWNSTPHVWRVRRPSGGLLILFLFGVIFLHFPYAVDAACTGSNPTWTSTPDQTSVASCISQAAVGATINISAGSASWSGLSINKAVHLRGAGVSQTAITLSGVTSVTKQSGGIVRVSGISFSKSGGGNESKGISIGGSWQGTEPVIFENNAYTISSSGLFRIDVAGGVIIASSTFSGGWDDSFIQPKAISDTQSWTTADTLGNRDTNGRRNIYIEDNTFDGGTNQGIDCDDASRCVYRYNRLTYSSFNSHGWDTSQVGVRHVEVYNNQFIHNGGTSQLANQSWAIWIRGGTGVIFNNQIADLAGSYWGNKPEMKFSIRGAEDARPQGSCSNVSYPVPRQLGQGHNGTSYFTDPIYIWGNTGAQMMDAGWHWGNPCGLTFTNYFQQGRDYFTGSAKPGYTPYTYPHPFMRVYSRFQPTYSGVVDAHNGLRITGRYTGPGTIPNGSNFFLVNIENSKYQGEGEPGYTNAYVYHPEQDDAYGEHWYPDGTVGNGTPNFGPFFTVRPKVNPARGQWISFELMVQLNTPGSRDGRVAVWQDGQLIADWPNIRFRDVSTVQIDEIQLENAGKVRARLMTSGMTTWSSPSLTSVLYPPERLLHLPPVHPVTSMTAGSPMSSMFSNASIKCWASFPVPLAISTAVVAA